MFHNAHLSLSLYLCLSLSLPPLQPVFFLSRSLCCFAMCKMDNQLKKETVGPKQTTFLLLAFQSSLSICVIHSETTKFRQSFFLNIIDTTHHAKLCMNRSDYQLLDVGETWCVHVCVLVCFEWMSSLGFVVTL